MRFWAVFLSGIAFGVIGAILMTPQTGAEMRRNVMTRLQQQRPWPRRFREAA